jgi:quinol monooxygenase YgiN
MIIFRTTFQIKPEHRAEFLEAMVDIASATVPLPGCVRFEIIHDESDPNRLAVDEVFRDDDAVKAFAQSPHVASWRQKYSNMGDWYVQDSIKERLNNVFPPNPA